ncbi:hypothetical protein ACFW92_12425 [Streptomyces scopuliridis]|uniref:hypothetical protein n=1 Tax=Streptomyces scopuliridis TaxID=452529 RepID=UPI00369141C9
MYSDLAHDDSGRPLLTSDDATMPPRSLAQPHPLSADRDVPWAAGIAVPAFDVVPPVAPRPGRISALAALWILRC